MDRSGYMYCSRWVLWNCSDSKKKIHSFNELTRPIFGPKLSPFVNIVSLGYLIGGLIIMISGSGCSVGEVSYGPFPIREMFTSIKSFADSSINTFVS